MNHGFLRIGAAAPEIKIADCRHNKFEILKLIGKAAEAKCEILLLPELCLTGSTCGDLFLFPDLITEAQESLEQIADESDGFDMLTVIGLPYIKDGLLCDCAAGIYKGEILGVVGKKFLSAEELRFFGAAADRGVIDFNGMEISVEIGADAYASNPRECGALVLNPSAEYETAGSAAARGRFASQRSLHSVCGYARAGAGKGESTTDAVFSGHCMIAEFGEVLSETVPFENGLIYTDVDMGFLYAERIAQKFKNTCAIKNTDTDIKLVRKFTATPFVPENGLERGAEVLTMQCAGLEQRLSHMGAKDIVLGFSGGLDSALALAAAVKTFDNMSIPRKRVCAVSMPCFGTSERTRSNSRGLATALGCAFTEIPIAASVEQHFKDIGHDMNNTDLVFENAQARERTQVLMDLAGKLRGLVLGTGDMSELALGFATYNGDHMSMYGVNASVPKTLIPHILLSFAQGLPEDAREILRDIINTPVSPELLPPDKITGETQETEKTVGPYILHDFFMYHFIWRRAGIRKIFLLARETFSEIYSADEIKKWLDVFVNRFYANQFKRSCLPDGPRIFTRSLSPRGGLVMPSDVKKEKH